MIMKEYAFLPMSQLDPLRAEFMPPRPAKRFLSCIDGAKKEERERNLVINVSPEEWKSSGRIIFFIWSFYLISSFGSKIFIFCFTFYN